MTEQEKADEIWDQMKGFRISHNHRRKCCLVCVDQIVQAIDFDWMEVQNLEREHKYWEGVRKILEQKGK